MDKDIAEMLSNITKLQKLADDKMTVEDRQIAVDTCEGLWTKNELWLIARDILTPEQIAAFSITVYTMDEENTEQRKHLIDRLADGLSDAVADVPNAEKILLAGLEADLSTEVLWDLCVQVLEPSQLFEVMKCAIELDFGDAFEVDFDI